MQVKKFEAPTMAEALNLVKTELGPEAIILSTKNHRKGFGLLSKASVEVTAAVSDKSLTKKAVTEKLVPQQTRSQIDKLSASKQSEVYDEFNGYYERRKNARTGQQAQQTREPNPLLANAPNLSQPVKVERGGGAFAAAASGRAQPKAQPAPGKTSTPPRYIDIADEDDEAPAQSSGYGRNGRVAAAAARAEGEFEQPVRGSRQASAPQQAQPAPQQQSFASETRAQQRYEAPPVAMMGSDADVTAMQEDIQRLKSMLEELKSEQMALADSKITESTSDELQVEFNNLLRNGIDKRFATPLVKQVTFALPREALASSEKIVEALAVEIMENMKVDNPLDFKAGSERRVFALIGPTGVGKTTTIAKLASQAILHKNLRVGLINLDSYKVAALDQLATYAKILNVPFRQASNSVELERALQEFKPLDLVLIDTSGRSQRDSDSLTQMKAMLAENTAIRPLLIMSATTRDQELYDIITRFKIFSPSGLVFSKLDETSTFGCIYNVAMKTGLPMTYFTVGQRVPEDIEPASRERVADLILDI